MKKSKAKPNEINPRTGKRYKFSKESRENMCKPKSDTSLMGKFKRTKKYRDNLRKKNTGQVRSEETRKKMSESHKGKKRPKWIHKKWNEGRERWLKELRKSKEKNSK